MADATCEYCNEYYTDPRMLPCLHTFCLQCLDKEAKKEGLVDTLHCRTCQEKLILSENGVSELPQSLYEAQKAEMARNSSSTTVVCQQQFCSHHDVNPLEVYCQQCNKVVCKDCMSYDHYNHRSEFCNINEEVAKREMESLLTYLAESKRSVSSLEDAIEKCKKTMQLVESKKKEVDAEIGNSLEKVRTALLEQNEELRSTKITNLEEQVQELQQLRDGLSHTADMIKSAQSYSPAQQLAIKKTLEERAKGLQKEFEGSGPKRHPSESDVFVTAIVNADTVAKVIGLGQVWGERSEAASSTCDVDDMPRALAGKSHTFTVTARDTSGNPCGYGNKVAAKLVLNGFPALNGEVTDRGRGSYSVILAPETPGKYDLHVTIGEGHIKGSPFEYHVAQPRKTAYTELYAQQTITTNLKPHDVAVTEEEQLAVAELGTHTVTLYSMTGERKYSFRTADNQGNADGQFNAPSAVAIRGDIMYVAEKGNNRVQKFSISQRRFISKFGSKGNGPGQFSEIYGICIDSKGKVFVTDWNNRCSMTTIAIPTPFTARRSLGG